MKIVDKKKILIIDDETAILLVTRRRLEGRNYEVITADGGKEGIEKAIAFKPDLILLDLVMPGPDGYEVCRRLKATEETREIPIIVFTASSWVNDSIQKKVIGLGAAGYLEKPFQSDDLIAIIEKNLSGSETDGKRKNSASSFQK